MLHPSYTDLMKVVNRDVEERATKICKQPSIRLFWRFQKEQDRLSAENYL